MYTAVTRHLGRVCERTAGTEPCVHSENILSGEAGDPSQQDAHGPQSFSLGSCTSKWEGLHGNCLIIFWGCFLRVRSQGCLQKAEGQSHAFIHCPMLGHSSTARSQRGKREGEDTELLLQEALLCELSFYLGTDVCVLDKIPLCKPRLSLEPEFLLPQPPSSG